MLQNPEISEHWQDAKSREFHTWPYVKDESQNVGTVKVLDKITFRLCI